MHFPHYYEDACSLRQSNFSQIMKYMILIIVLIFLCLSPASGQCICKYIHDPSAVCVNLCDWWCCHFVFPPIQTSHKHTFYPSIFYFQSILTVCVVVTVMRGMMLCYHGDWEGWVGVKCCVRACTTHRHQLSFLQLLMIVL